MKKKKFTAKFFDKLGYDWSNDYIVNIRYCPPSEREKRELYESGDVYDNVIRFDISSEDYCCALDVVGFIDWNYGKNKKAPKYLSDLIRYILTTKNQRAYICTLQDKEQKDALRIMKNAGFKVSSHFKSNHGNYYITLLIFDTDEQKKKLI